MLKIYLPFLLLIIFFLLPVHTTHAQNPKHEFRAVWIATIGGIDWPNPKNRNPADQQQELITLLNTLQATGINAVIFQVRPAADAFYESSYEPWSKYLTGHQGVAPEPYYDPLLFMITECHKRGMELHAWFNPYRALVDANKNPNPSNHITFTHPNWFVNYGGKKYFNPGLPEVRKYVSDVVLEVVKKYDIDAVHFDDYFYPYRIGKLDFPDQNAFVQYGTNYTNKDDWRRENVNQFIKNINTAIKKIKPYVKLGISPFGVWRNASKDPEGSNTRGGQTNYDDLFADVILWQKNGWIDYLLPQLYWERNHKYVSYDTLINWWSAHAYGRAMYVGHGLYQLGVNKAASWHSVNEIFEQIQVSRQTNNIGGSSWYSANYFYKNKYNVIGQMQNTVYNSKAIIPPMPWLDNIAPLKPEVHFIKNKDGTATINMKQKSIDANRYVIYKIDRNESININNANKIIAIQNENTYTPKENSNAYKYIITSLDRNNNESEGVEVK